MTNPITNYLKDRRQKQRRAAIEEATDIVHNLSVDLKDLHTLRFDSLKAGNTTEVEWYNNVIREAARTQSYLLEEINDRLGEKH